MPDHLIDYELLVEAIVSAPLPALSSLCPTFENLTFLKNETLRSDSLRRLAMRSSKVVSIDKAHVIAGGYGDVQKAAFAGSDHVIAVKRLRPEGDIYSRVRTIAVRRALFSLL